MKKPKAPRVPILENAFEVNLPKLTRMTKATGKSQVVLDDGVVRTVAILAETRLAVFLGGRPWIVDIVPVQCLKGRVRPLLKCPRAHEGNFQSLYWSGTELACRRCLGLRYRSNLAATSSDRARLARIKLLATMGGEQGQLFAERRAFKWRKRRLRLSTRLVYLTRLHYQTVREWLQRHAGG
jgi:hypothetical protein